MLSNLNKNFFLRLKAIPLIFGFYVLFAPSTWATTSYRFGTIMEVDADGTKRKVPSFRVLLEFHNLKTAALWLDEWYPIDNNTRHGKSVYFLDGKPSNPREALKPGLAVVIADGGVSVFVSSRPGPRAQTDPGHADAALYRIELPNAFQVTAKAIDFGNPGSALGEPKPVKSPVQLLFEVNGNEIHGLTLVVSGVEYRADFVPDEMHLTFANGTISGTISTVFDFDYRNKVVMMHAFIPKEGDRIPGKYSLKIQTDAKGVASGSFEGTCGGTKVQGNVTGERLARVEMPTPTRVWLLLGQLGSWKMKYVVFDVDQGKAKPGGIIIDRKGRNPLVLTAQDVTLTGTSVKGVLKGLMEMKKPVEIVLDGTVLANRLILGTFTLKNQEGEEITDHFRGGFTFQDGPQMYGYTKEQEKTVKELQAAMETKK